MATVRVSDALIDSVQRNVSKIFDKRLNELSKDIATDAELLEIFNVWFAPYETAIKSVPKEFFMCKDILAVDVEGVKLGDVKLTQELPMPMNNVDTHRFQFLASNWTPRLRVKDVPENSKYTAKAKEYADARDAIRAESSTMITNVKALLRSHATLAPALKKWPPLWDLLDEQYQERHKKVVLREQKTTEKDEDLADIDFDSMTGVVVSNKLAG